jgi:hypothetical protein
MSMSGDQQVGRTGDRRPVQLAGLRLGHGQKIAERFHLERWRHTERNHGRTDARHRCEIARIIGQLAVQERMRGEGRRGSEQQDVVVMGADKGIDGDESVTARPVLHDDGLAPFRRELFGDEPGTDVGARAGTERQHEFHRPLRPWRGLRHGG